MTSSTASSTEATAAAATAGAEATSAPVASGGTSATDLGTDKRPIKMYFVPSAEAAKVLEDGNKVADALSKATGLKFETAVPTNYAAVIEAMGSDEADIAWLATFAYVLAHDKYGAEVALTTLRNGMDTYKGEIIARADSGINKIEDCNGKTMAYTDAASTSGYVYPSGMFAQKGIKPSSEQFAGGHPQAVLAVYEGNADCGATYFSPPGPDGVIADGRATALKTHPDAAEKLKIIGYTNDIPNDTVSFRKGFPPELRDKIVDALLKYADTNDGKAVLKDLYSITGFTKSDDSRYNVVRETVKALGKNPSDFVK
jgi:phosphonate transport system substrate-binding protein